MKKLLICLMAYTLSGCAALLPKTVNSPTVEIVGQQKIRLPKPNQIAFNGTATQILTAQYHVQNKTHTYTSQVQVEKTPDHLVLVAVAGWGGEVFSLEYNGINIKTSSLPMPHATVGIQHVLSDFILTYAQPSLLRKLLKTTDLRLQIKKHQRLFLLHHKPIITIDYQYTNPWKGKVVLHNLALHYTITIQTVTFHY